MKVRLIVVAVIAALTPVLALTTPASAVRPMGSAAWKTLTFDEIAPQAADGLHTGAIKFGFKVAGVPAPADATYGGVGPGTTKYVDDPVLEGNAAGELTLKFDTPTHGLQFGVALSTDVKLKAGFTVELFDSTGTSLGIYPVKTKVFGTFSEARFLKKGLAIKKAIIIFDGVHSSRFALDNLKYTAV